VSENGFSRQYYDYLWSESDHSIALDDEQRIEQSISLVPRDCSSILDIGCGDGRVTNRLTSKCVSAVGLDSSIEALQHVKTAKVLGDIARLPFPDKSFDLVLCCEVLEHLPYQIYQLALAEMERVAAKYVIITVPNNENLRGSSTFCPACGCFFHPGRHVRSFDRQKLGRLFQQFSLEEYELCSPISVYPSLLIRLAKLIRLVPDIPRNPFPRTALCPQCGYSLPSVGESSGLSTVNDKGNPLIRLILRVLRTLTPKRKSARWCLTLYQRNHSYENS
jgi:SAM-dependent methyltransferase